MDKQRLFVGVRPTPSIIKELLRVQRALGELGPIASVPKLCRWIEPENIHLTLSFLGQVEASRIGPLVETLAAAAAGSVPHLQPLDKLVLFPSPISAKVAGLGAAVPVEPLKALAEALFAGLERLGFPREARAFVPHITLARFREELRWHGDGPPSSLGDAPVGLSVGALTLFRSHLSGKGSRYEILKELPLAPRK